MHTPNASDHTVRWKIMGLVVGEQTVFDKLRFWVKQKPQSLTTEQLALGSVFFVILVRTALFGAGLCSVKSFDRISRMGRMAGHGPAYYTNL